MSGNYNVRVGPTALGYAWNDWMLDGGLTVLTIIPIGSVSQLRHVALFTGGGMAASFAMAAVEMAPVSEEHRGTLRFAAALAAGLGGATATNVGLNVVRRQMPLLVARTLDLARVRVALMENTAAINSLRATGASVPVFLQVRRAALMAQRDALAGRIAAMRTLGGPALANAESQLNNRMRELANVESRINAPGIGPGGRAVQMRGAAMQQARQNVREAIRSLNEQHDRLAEGLASTIGGSPMDPADLAVLKTSFENTGGRILQSAEIDRYLLWRAGNMGVENVGGVTFNANEIWLPTNATRTAVYEELIHAGQHRTGRVSQLIDQFGNVEAERLLEIEAAETLIRNRHVWHLPSDEIREVIRRLRGLRAQGGS